jgi:hypothetical protein
MHPVQSPLLTRTMAIWIIARPEDVTRRVTARRRSRGHHDSVCSMEQALGADLMMLVDAETRKRVWEELRRVGEIEWAEGTVKTLTDRQRRIIGNLRADYGVDKRIERIKGYIFLGDAERGWAQGKKERRMSKKVSLKHGGIRRRVASG